LNAALSFEGFKRPDINDFLKLDQELYKAFQLSSNLNLDYIERLNDEHKLLLLGQEVFSYIQRRYTANVNEHKA